MHKEFLKLIELYKDEIIAFMYPLMLELESRMVERMVHLERQVNEATGSVRREKDSLLNPKDREIALDSVRREDEGIDSVKREDEGRVQSDILELIHKAEVIQVALIGNNKTILERLEKL